MKEVYSEDISDTTSIDTGKWSVGDIKKVIWSTIIGPVRDTATIMSIAGCNQALGCGDATETFRIIQHCVVNTKGKREVGNKYIPE